MPVLRTSFSERDPVKVGVVGTAVLAVLALLLFNSVSIYQSWFTTSYAAEFTEAGGLVTGNPVRLNGAEIGRVDSVELDGERVRVEFAINDVGRLGVDTRAAISADTILGTRALALTPLGPGELEAGATIPVERTTSPYDITQALSTLTSKSEQLDHQELVRALDTLSETFANSPVPLRSTLDGVSRLSRTIATRDATLRELLTHAQSITGLLAERSGDIVALTVEGRQLLVELNRRQDQIRQLFVNVTETVEQLKGLVKDNEDRLEPALEELQETLDLLDRNDKNIAAVIHGLSTYIGGLGEALGGGPWFFAYLQNLACGVATLGGQPCADPVAGVAPSTLARDTMTKVSPLDELTARSGPLAPPGAASPRSPSAGSAPVPSILDPAAGLTGGGR